MTHWLVVVCDNCKDETKMPERNSRDFGTPAGPGDWYTPTNWGRGPIPLEGGGEKNGDLCPSCVEAAKVARASALRGRQSKEDE